MNNFKKAIYYFEKIKEEKVDLTLGGSNILLGKAYYLNNNFVKAINEEVKIIKYRKKEPEIVDSEDENTAISIIEEITSDIFPGIIKDEFLSTINSYKEGSKSILQIYFKLGNCFLKIFSFNNAIKSYLFCLKIIINPSLL
jgi:tetratricopeptide (TPR) repeat protein